MEDSIEDMVENIIKKKQAIKKYTYQKLEGEIKRGSLPTFKKIPKGPWNR